VRIRVIALNTFGSFLHNRLMLLFAVVFASWILLMMAPLLMMKAITTLTNAHRMESEVLGIVSIVMSGVSGSGSLLAAWAAADSLAGEIKSGTILAVMARPVRRWEFLLGKFAGVQLLLGCYVLGMLGLSYVLAWMGGQQIHSSVWPLIVYPLVRYAIYSAVGLMLATYVHQAVAMAAVWAMAVLVAVVTPSGASQLIPDSLRVPIYYLLPSTNLLSESRFLTITEASVHHISWLQHLTALAYGLDYAAVWLLLAIWSFRRRGITSD
jgi:ABC-type transport system involved in multi-copper enzyme maturation permease subunit